MVHSGGMARRGTLSDGMITASAKDAIIQLVVSAGNGDGFFTNIYASYDVPLYQFSTQVSLAIPFRQLFGIQA